MDKRILIEEEGHHVFIRTERQKMWMEFCRSHPRAGVYPSVSEMAPLAVAWDVAEWEEGGVSRYKVDPLKEWWIFDFREFGWPLLGWTTAEWPEFGWSSCRLALWFVMDDIETPFVVQEIVKTMMNQGARIPDEPALEAYFERVDGWFRP